MSPPLNPGSASWPVGTRVVLIEAIEHEGRVIKAGTMAVLTSEARDTGFAALETPGGRRFQALRRQLVLQRRRVLDEASDGPPWPRLRTRIVLASVVGSTAWGLSEEHSDQDIRGVYLEPFRDTVGVRKVPDVIQDPNADGAYFELRKLVRLGLNADPNALELLWSPLVVAMSPLGRRLRDRRHMFTSEAVVGSFGRYGLSQFRKVRRRLESPGRHARPKNAYNLIRLLHSALHWMSQGEPLIRVTGPLRDELLAIKRGEIPIEDTLKRGEELARELEDRHSQGTRLPTLPPKPDTRAAEDFLVEARALALAEAAGLVVDAPEAPAPILTEADWPDPLPPREG